jgi:hypothetical protein
MSALEARYLTQRLELPIYGEDWPRYGRDFAALSDAMVLAREIEKQKWHLPVNTGDGNEQADA